MADRYRFDAVETGGTVVFQRVADTIFATAVTSLGTALILSALFLLLVYYLLLGAPRLSVVTLFPIVVTATLLVGTMRMLAIPFNTLTATILSITVGVGIDYAVHVVHRFVTRSKHGRIPTARRSSPSAERGRVGRKYAHYHQRRSRIVLPVDHAAAQTVRAAHDHQRDLRVPHICDRSPRRARSLSPVFVGPGATTTTSTSCGALR